MPHDQPPAEYVLDRQSVDNDSKYLERITNPYMYILVNGKRISAECVNQNIYTFQIAKIDGPLRIRSLTANPRYDFNSVDNRQIGVAVKNIVVAHDETSLNINYRSDLLSEGFYPAEPEIRWTNGDALISDKVFDAIGRDNIVIRIEIMPWISYSQDILEIDGPIPGPPLTRHEDHYEGICFSSDGNILAVAAAGVDAVLLFGRNSTGEFDSCPFRRLGGTRHGFIFVHDVAFMNFNGQDYIAALERRGRITIWNIANEQERYSDFLVGQFEIDPIEHLKLSVPRECWADAISFLLEGEKIYLIVAEFMSNSVITFEITFTEQFDVRFISSFANPFLSGPEGLAFSNCGRWLAATNHSSHTVAIFERILPQGNGDPKYDSNPIAIINHSCLKHPHSVAFLSETNDLIITNSASPKVNIFKFQGRINAPRWSVTPSVEFTFTPAPIFQDVLDRGLDMEGGAKGVAIFGNEVALCSPEMGVQLFNISRRLQTVRFADVDFESEP